MAATLLPDLTPSQRRRAGRDILKFHHRLDETGLFSDGALARLLDETPRDRLSIRTACAEADEPWIAGEAGRLSGAELVSAIRLVHQGGLYLHTPEVSSALTEYLEQGKSPDEETSYDTLTDREKQVLKLLAEGHSNKEIADLLYLSIKTVMAHRANIMEKLGIHNRTELVKYAIRSGLIQVQSEI